MNANDSGAFCVHVTKDYIGFSSAHFITYDGHACETLHGHNYRVRVTLAGPVDENYYVLDFTRIKKMMKRLCDEMDHRMLLPLHNRLMTLEQRDDGVSVCYKQRHFFFPREDVVLLPVPNTTAEMLAQYLCQRVKEELKPLNPPPLDYIELEVEESPGQSAVYREEGMSRMTS
jgi:6-pyruvoyltetrahydropterin/6-carboxytetrahydropterin synthase